MTSHPEINPQLLRRCLSAQTALGRWRLNRRVAWRRWWWNWIPAGGRLAKRGLDVAGSLVFILLFSPLFLLLCLLVRLEDGGPAVFKQIRVGRFGREFRMYKFRSMRPDAEVRLVEVLAHNRHAEGVTFKIQNDPRLTRTGRWLRKFSLDELPQFFNVLKGDMSLVGPRPPLPREVALYSFADRRRLAIQPGITCLWQIGGRSEIDFSGQVNLDVKYIETRGFLVDVKILAQTVPAVISGRGAC